MAASCLMGRFFWSKGQGPMLLDIIGNMKREKNARSHDQTPAQTSQDNVGAGRILFESMGHHRFYEVPDFGSD